MSVKEMMLRVRGVLEDAGLSQAEFSRMIGVSPQTLSGWMSGRNKPGVEEMAAMCQALKVSPSWMMTGYDNMPGYQSFVTEDTVIIPMLDIRGSCGSNGSDVSNASLITLLHVTPNWVNEHCGLVNKRSLNIIGATGDSMSPTLEDGDAAIIDTSVKTVYTDAVFAFTIENDMYIKRLQRVGLGIQVISDNPRYAPYMLNLSELGDRFQVLGKMVSTILVRRS